MKKMDGWDKSKTWSWDIACWHHCPQQWRLHHQEASRYPLDVEAHRVFVHRSAPLFLPEDKPGDSVKAIDSEISGLLDFYPIQDVAKYAERYVKYCYGIRDLLEQPKPPAALSDFIHGKIVTLDVKCGFETPYEVTHTVLVAMRGDNISIANFMQPSFSIRGGEPVGSTPLHWADLSAALQVASTASEDKVRVVLFAPDDPDSMIHGTKSRVKISAKSFTCDSARVKQGATKFSWVSQLALRAQAIGAYYTCRKRIYNCAGCMFRSSCWSVQE